MSEAGSSARGTPVDLTRSPPLPAPTTVSSRSLRPRRPRGRSSAASSAVSSSRSRSHSLAGDPQPLRLDTGNAAGQKNVRAKRRRSQSPTESSGSRLKKKPHHGTDGAQAGGSDIVRSHSAETSGEGGSTFRTAPSNSEPIAGSSMPATLNSSLLDHPVKVSQRTRDDSLAGSSRTSPSDVDTLPGAEIQKTRIAGPGRTPSHPAQSGDDESSATFWSSSSRQKPHTGAPEPVPTSQGEPLAAYTCPICFSAPSHATITPCGHVLCGECLFTAVKTSIQRGAYSLPHGEHMIARCPVCRAPIPGWDGKGGGIIGLKPRAVFSL
ncbi:hypothetical protein C8T65DRAFT_632019 [Cerioporus squamosus]|nr:hypothetical protein C8T65DRAFT_632019 [Cerioporus squamosus]